MNQLINARNRSVLPFLLAIATIVLPAVAHAEDWFYLTSSDDDTKFFIDRSSISRQGNFVKVKGFYVYEKVDQDGTIAIMNLMEFSCREKKMRYLEIKNLLEDQSIKIPRLDSEWLPVKAETVAAIGLEAVCNTNNKQ